MENTKGFAIGDTVYFIVETMCSGIIHKFLTLDEKVYVRVESVKSTRYGWKYGTMNLNVEDCFKTEKEALDNRQGQFKEKTNNYVEAIKTPEDLVQFMFDHVVACSDDTDWAAREAVRITAKNIMGINLKE